MLDRGAQWRTIALSALDEIKAAQRGQTRIHGGIVSDFEFTFAAIVTGKYYSGVMSVGDCTVAPSFQLPQPHSRYLQSPLVISTKPFLWGILRILCLTFA